MARPVGSDSTATRKRIVRAAARLFAKHGRDGTTMRAISRKSGFGLATLHHHFGNKEGLYAACVDGMYDAFDVLRESLAASWSEGARTPAEVLEDAVRRSYRFACSNRQAVMLTTRDAIEAGIDPRRRERLLVPGLEQGVALLSQLTGKSERDMRLAVRSISYLVVRYALTTEDDLTPVVGSEGDASAVEDHLVFLAFAALGLEAP